MVLPIVGPRRTEVGADLATQLKGGGGGGSCVAHERFTSVISTLGNDHLEVEDPTLDSIYIYICTIYHSCVSMCHSWFTSLEAVDD